MASSARACAASRVGVCSARSSSGAARTASTRTPTTATPSAASRSSLDSRVPTARRTGSGPSVNAVSSAVPASSVTTGSWASSPSSVASASSGVERQRPVRVSMPKSSRCAVSPGSTTRQVTPSGKLTSARSAVRACATSDSSRSSTGTSEITAVRTRKA